MINILEKNIKDKNLISINFESYGFCVLDGISSDELKFKSEIVFNSKPKRFLDLFISITCIVFIFPIIFIFVSLLIKITSKGPIFFVQKRVGLNGHYFNCFKFRTMRISTNESKFQPVSYADTRVTKVGLLLRKSNLDEIPQIFNVLLGDMSIVGPRPHAVAFHNEYSKFIPNIDFRHLVKPGITGLAQVFGHRGDELDKLKNIERTRKRVYFDIKYIRTYSIMLDVKIILTTFLQMLTKSTNGY